MHPTRTFLAAILISVVATGTTVAGPAEQNDFSPANTLLFVADHLANVNEPRVLRYDYSRSGALAPAFTDRVVLRVVDVTADGGKDVEIEFLSGERAHPAPPMSDVRGNPVVMMFLQREIYEMNRLTGGPWRYFQKRIKLALAESADVANVTIAFDGKDVEARRIRISPYLADPERARFDAFAEKFYEFVVADAVPGSIYQIRAVVPAAAGEDAASEAPPAMDDVLTYRP